MKTNILSRIIGNKPLLEEKARKLKAGSVGHATEFDILNAIKIFEQEYDIQTPENPMQYPLGMLLLKHAVGDVKLANEIYRDSKGNLYLSMANFKLRYSGWKQPFVRLNLN